MKYLLILLVIGSACHASVMPQDTPQETTLETTLETPQDTFNDVDCSGSKPLSSEDKVGCQDSEGQAAD